ncbi:hypothetical protein B0H13DRAFT_1922384 [Mycena leptocephala]|nr:hypothetical protein B0H13DRAFT_1922384 [Mycena leptocephala]
MDKLKSRFRLDRSVRNSATQASPITSASPADNCFTFRAYGDPSPSMPPAGSFESDIASSEYQQRWETWTDFENWIVQEQRSKGIELHLVNTYLGLPDFERKLRYVCSRAAYHSFILLCWWHVLHSWQKHFHIDAHPELWDLLKWWLRMTEKSEFDAAWVRIQNIAPVSFVEYFSKYWMLEKVVRMWWHHVLNGKFFHGKRNRRLDHLLSTLLTEVLPYYALKQRRQELGFEGPDIEVKKRQDITKRSKVYRKENIQQITHNKFIVPSKSDPTKVYEVDIDTYTCTCLDYPLISYCKHLCVVQALFDEPGTPADGPAASPHIPSLSTLNESTPSVDVPTLPIEPTGPSEAATRPLTRVVEKLEHLAARLRRPRKKDSQLSYLGDLEAAVDAMLLETDNGTVLPKAQYLAPNKSSSWAQTREAMMPDVKTKKKPAGDPSYGAGVNSGSKAKKAKLEKRTERQCSDECGCGLTFIKYARAATLIVETVLAHRDHGTGLNAQQRANSTAALRSFSYIPNTAEQRGHLAQLRSTALVERHRPAYMDLGPTALRRFLLAANYIPFAPRSPVPSYRPTVAYPAHLLYHPRSLRPTTSCDVHHHLLQALVPPPSPLLRTSHSLPTAISVSLPHLLVLRSLTSFPTLLPRAPSPSSSSSSFSRPPRASFLRADPERRACPSRRPTYRDKHKPKDMGDELSTRMAVLFLCGAFGERQETGWHRRARARRGLRVSVADRAV